MKWMVMLVALLAGCDEMLSITPEACKKLCEPRMVKEFSAARDCTCDDKITNPCPEAK
jgi:hypothetical protein